MNNKKSLWHSIIMLILMIAFASSCSSIATDPSNFDRAILQGIVFDGSSKGVQGMSITLDSKLTVESDLNGKFYFSNVKKGSHSILVKKDGFETVNLDFSFDSRTKIIYITSKNNMDYVLSAEKALTDNNVREAATQIQNALRLDPNNVLSRYIDVLIKVRMKEYSLALSIIKQLVADGVQEIALFTLLLDIAILDTSFEKEALALINNNSLIKDDPRIQESLKRISTRKQE